MAILLQPALTQFQGLAYLAMIAFAVTLIVSFVVLFRLFFGRGGEELTGVRSSGARTIIGRTSDWGIAMATATSEFFDGLAARGLEPGFARTTGSVRFDLTRDGTTEHWRVEFRRGAVTVARAADAADCVVRADASLFDDLARGRANAMAALLRGQLQADGEPGAPDPLPAALSGADRAEDDGVRSNRRQAEGLTMATQTVRILDGNTFVVCDERGDVEASPTEPTGLFSFDTRFLSKWTLTIDGQKLNSLSVDDLQYFQSRFFLVPGTGTVYIDAKLSVIRERSVGDGFHEELTVLNHESEPVELTIRIDAASDFADLFEVKDALKKVGDYAARIEDGRLHLQYTRETFKRETVISASAPASVDEHGLTFAVRIEPHGSWTTDLDVVTTRAGAAGTYATRSTSAAGSRPARTWREASNGGSGALPASNATSGR